MSDLPAQAAQFGGFLLPASGPGGAIRLRRRVVVAPSLRPPIKDAGANAEFLRHFRHRFAQMDQSDGLLLEITAVTFSNHAVHGACRLSPGPGF